MKNADKENQKRYTSVVASRAPGTEGQNEPAQPGGLDGKKNSGQRRSVFFLTPFMELIRSYGTEQVSVVSTLELLTCEMFEESLLTLCRNHRK